MIRRRATIARFGAFAILALMLSACIKLDMALTVNSDDTVDGTLVFGVSKQLLELTGQSPEDLLTDAPIPTDVEGVSTEPYEDDEFQGQQITLDGVPLDEFNQGSFAGDATGATGATGSGEQLQIVREGNNYVVSGVFDLSSIGASTGATGAAGTTGFPGAEELFRTAELKIAITFPGEVVRANGQVDGNTVTWTPRVGERLELQATGSATGGGSSSTMMILLIVGGLVIVAAIVAGILVSRRRQPAAATAGAPMTGPAPAQGQGTVMPPTTPPAATPPPPPPPSEPQP